MTPQSQTKGGDRPRVGLVLGAGGVLGGAWLVGALDAIARETGWDPGSADYIGGASAGAMVGALLAWGVPPWFMVGQSMGESFPGLAESQGGNGDPRGPAYRRTAPRYEVEE